MRINKVRQALIQTLLLLLLAGSVAAQRTKAPARDYFPLRVGDSWTYRHSDDESEFTVKVLSEEKQADGTTRYVVEKLVGTPIHSWYSKPRGWVLLHRESYPQQEGLDVKYEPTRQYLKNPLTRGAKWTWKGKDITGMDFFESNEVVAPEVVKTPAGTFRTMKIVSRVRGTETSRTNTSWYADGVGLVKFTTEAGPLKYGWELVDYSFKKKSLKR